MINLKYAYRVFLDQLPLKRMFRNFVVTRNAWGLFSKYSHTNKKGNPKVAYNTRETAEKAAKSMSKKHGYYYSIYVCLHCGKYHLGRNRTSINEFEKA